MLTIQTGSSCNPNPEEAAQEAISKLNTSKCPKLIFVYSSIEYDTKALLDAIICQFPDAKIVGNTSFTASITQAGTVDAAKGFVSIMAFYDDIEAAVAVGNKGECPIQTGRELAKKALQTMRYRDSSLTPSHFFMSATPGYEEEYLKGITEVLGNIPCFGGSAADNDISGKWRVYAQDEVVEEGVAIALICSPKKIKNHLFGFYNNTQNFGKITAMKDKRTLSSIDHKPALETYCEWTQADRSEVQGNNMLGYSIFKPLAIRDISTDVLAIKHPMASDEKNIILSNNAQVGDTILQLETTQDDLIKAISKGLTDLIMGLDYPISGVHFVHCAGRKVGIAERADEIEKELKKVLGSIPFIVEFTFGEYGSPAPHSSICAGLMLSVTVFEK